jgi:hypothetical protein
MKNRNRIRSLRPPLALSASVPYHFTGTDKFNNVISHLDSNLLSAVTRQPNVLVILMQFILNDNHEYVKYRYYSENRFCTKRPVNGYK